MPAYIQNGIQVVESNDDIFRVKTQAIVNPVNLVGVMGKGLAKEVKDRYPDAYQFYRNRCRNGSFQIGQVLVSYLQNGSYFRDGNTEMIIHFPTKQHWRDLSDYSYIEEGLKALVNCTNHERLYSIAIPPLGCGLGGLQSSQVKGMILDIYLPQVTKYLKELILLRF